jgi:zinc protease
MYKKTWILILTVLVIRILMSSNSWGFEYKRVVLANGLTIIHYEIKELPLIRAELLIEASPLDEPSSLAGLANLTSLMLAEGTKTRTSEQISQETEFMAADIGASTSDDYTTVTLFTLKKDFKHGFEIFSDIIQNPIFPAKEFLRNKEILLDSLKQQEESPSFLAMRAFRKELFLDHPYGRFATGDINTIPNIKQSDLEHFHSVFYIPKGAILTVVGDISFEDTLKLAEQYLSNWKNNDHIQPKMGESTGRTIKKIITIDKPLTQATIIIGGIGIKRSNPDYYKLSVMNYILGGGGFRSRLMQNIRNKRGYAYDVHSYFKTNKYGGYFSINVKTKNELSDKVIAEVLNEVKNIMNSNVTEDELSDAKAFLTGSFPLRLDTISEMASFFTMAEFYGLGMSYDKDFINYINNVTTADVKDVASRYLDDKNYVLVIVGDMKKVNTEK